MASSSLREELYNTFFKAQSSSESTQQEAREEEPRPQHSNDDASAQMDSERKRNARREQAVREREAKVKAQLNRVGTDIGRSKMNLNQEEGEREFRCASHSFLCHCAEYDQWRSPTCRITQDSTG